MHGSAPNSEKLDPKKLRFNYGTLFQKRSSVRGNDFRFHSEELELKRVTTSSSASPSMGSASTSSGVASQVSPIFLVGLASCFLLLIVMAAYAYSARRRRRSAYSTTTHFLNLDHRILLLRKENPYEKSYLVQTAYNTTNRKTTPAVRSPSQNNVPLGLKSKSPSPTSSTGKEFEAVVSSKDGLNSSNQSVKSITPDKISPTGSTAPLQDPAPIAPNGELVLEKVQSIQQQSSCLSSLGKLHFKLKYSYEKRALCLIINRCTDLAIPKGAVSGSGSDPYVKMQLLPEKQHKAKTRVLRKTQNPVYNEEFTFFGITPTVLDNLAVHFLVLNFDRFSKDEIVGEVVCKLNQFEFDTLEKQITLVRDISPRGIKTKVQELGELLVSLCYQPIANRLTVVILKARNLPRMDLTGLCDPYVKIYVFHKEARLFKKRTHVKKRTLSPVFNESFAFDIPPEDGLDNIHIQFQVYDHDRVTRNELIGKIDIGIDTGNPESDKQWHEVIKSPRRQIAEWHKLKAI